MTKGVSGASNSRPGPVVEGLVLAALLGLGLQAALAAASAVYQAEHGMVFYVPVGLVTGFAKGPWGADLLGTWIALAAASSGAFAAGIRGAWRTAAIFSVSASAYLIAVAIRSAVAVSAERQLTIGLGQPDSFPGRYMAFTATPGFLAIGALAACLAIFTAIWSRRQTTLPRSWWWLAPAAVLAAVLSLVGDGNAAQDSSSGVSISYPPQGGIMTAFQILVAAAMVLGLIWSFRRPQVGWAVGVLAIPFVIHQISDLTIGNFYYGYLYQPGWETALPLILAVTGIVALIAVATLSAHRLHAS